MQTGPVKLSSVSKTKTKKKKKTVGRHIITRRLCSHDLSDGAFKFATSIIIDRQTIAAAGSRKVLALQQLNRNSPHAFRSEPNRLTSDSECVPQQSTVARTTNGSRLSKLPYTQISSSRYSLMHHHTENSEADKTVWHQIYDSWA